MIEAVTFLLLIYGYADNRFLLLFSWANPSIKALADKNETFAVQMRPTILVQWMLGVLYGIQSSTGVAFPSPTKGPTQYTTVVTFGDPTTDSGTAYRLSNGTWPHFPPFNRKGGFSEGLLWNEVLTQREFLNATLSDFSCGSSTTDSELAQGTMSRSPNLLLNYDIRRHVQSPGVRQQIGQYINSVRNQTIDFDRTLYMIWSGTNNYFFNRTLTPSDTAQSLIDSANLLIRLGGKHLVVINEPPYDRHPAFRDQPDTNATRNLYLDHNRVLNSKFKENFASTNIRLFDSHSFISKIMDHPLNYGFENLESCWKTFSGSSVQVLCSDISKRMFCDEVHFTSKMQSMIAEEFYRLLV